MKKWRLVAMVLCCMLSLGCVEEAQTPSYQAQPSQAAPALVVLPGQEQKMPVNPALVKTPQMPVVDCSRWLPDGRQFAYEARNLTIWGHSMVPFMQDGSVVKVASAPVSELRIGDVVCWSLSYNQKNAQENVNLTEVAIKLNLGLGVKVEVPWWAAQPSGGICHQIVWRNETHFITEGTNAATNSVVDVMPPQSFSENYRVKVIFDSVTQAQLFQFWQDNRQRLAANVAASKGENMVIVWPWCESGDM